jgi:meso-butanediol dehydrogenase/(S,S)-butanediol dehydrogenase/diacetyl reductase
MGRLDGKVAIITGGGSGIGEASSLLWAREGAKMVVVDWVSETGESTVEQIKAAGGEAIFVKADVTKAEDVQKIVQTAVKTYGRLDILFNNAGILGPMGKSTADFDEEDADRLIAVNFKGVFLGTKYAIPEMIKSGGGSIISTASDCAVHACLTLSVYAATKGAIISFTRTVAMEYASQGIRCNTVSPCAVETPMHAAALGTPEWKQFAESLPMGRASQPQDAAHAALFLASDESKYINAANLMVDGGFSVR